MAGIGLGYNDQKIIEAHDLITAIAVHQPIQPDVRFAYKVNNVIDAVDLSCQEHCWVQVSEFDTEVDRVLRRTTAKENIVRIGLVTDSLGHPPFDELMETVANLGIRALEFSSGGWSSAPHVNLDFLLESETDRANLVEKIRDHGLEISTLNCSGNQLALGEGGQSNDRMVRNTMKLASSK